MIMENHPKTATVSTRIATGVEDISPLAALTKTVLVAENAKQAYGHTRAIRRQNRKKTWALWESTSVLKEMIALLIARQVMNQKRGMLA
jgi:hypothetical protein